MIAFILLHWVLALCGAGFVAALGAIVSVLGLSTVLKRWKIIVAGLVTLTLLIVVAFLYINLEKTKATAATDKANYAVVVAQGKTLNATNLNLVAQLKLQSQSIADAANAASAAQAVSKGAEFTALAKQASDAKTIATLQARVSNPKTDEGSCDDEISILRTGI